jgi:hypothetical protein
MLPKVGMVGAGLLFWATLARVIQIHRDQSIG